MSLPRRLHSFGSRARCSDRTGRCVARAVLLALPLLLSCNDADLASILSPGGAAITLSPTAVTFAATFGAPAPAARVVTVQSSSPLSVTVSATEGWLSVQYTGSALNVAVQSTGLTPGLYAAEVTLTQTLPPFATATLPINLNVTGGAAINLSLSTVSFAAVVAGASPTPRTVNVTSSGTALLTGLSAAVTYTAGQPTSWLTTSLSSTTAPATLTLTATTGSLPAGTYTAIVNVSSSAPGVLNSPRPLSVSFTVGAASTIVVSASALTFSGVAGGASPAAQILAVTNGGTATLTGLSTSITYAAGQPTGWLSATLSATTAPATLTITANTAGRSAGTYNATVNVASGASNVTNSPRQINVTLTVTAPPSITLSSTAVPLNGFAGATSPVQATVNVTNGGSGTLNGLATTIAYQAGQIGNWLTADLSSTTAPATIQLSAATANLTAGTYNATVSVSSTATGVTNSPRTFTVTLTVVAPPSIVLSSNAVGLAATAGGANPATSVAISVTNGAAGTLAGLAASPRYTAGQPTGWLTATLNSQSAPATLTIGVNAGTLPAGNYSAVVDITSTTAGVINSPLALPVNFRVAAPASGSITGSSLLSGAISSLGEVDIFSYTASANSRIALHLVQTSGFTTGGFTPNPRATLITSSGTTTSTVTASAAAGSSATIDISQAGTYTLRVQSADLSGTGTYHVGIADLQPANPIAQLACGGVLTGRISVLGQIDTHTFNATTGSQIQLSLAEVTGFGSAGFNPRARMTLYAPSGATVGTATTGLASGATLNATLTENGSYLLTIMSANMLGTGTYNVGRTCLN